MKKYWLLKQEPSSYPFEQLIEDEKTDWTGVRNFQARNYLREMSVGDPVLYYHSGTQKQAYGLAEVTRSAFPDPTDEAWVAVEIKALRKLARPLELAEIKNNPVLAELQLLKQGRLSVSAMTEREFGEILEMAGESEL